MPTLIGQGQADTLFNLQESVATYTALKRQGTPVALVWQSWGHSDYEPPARRARPAAPRAVAARAGRRWPGSTTTCAASAPVAAAGLHLLPGLGLRGDAATSRQAYATAPSYPVGSTRTLLPLRHQRRRVTDGRAGQQPRHGRPRAPARYGSAAPIGPNYTETSGVDQDQAGHRPAGARRSGSRPHPLTQPGGRRRLAAADACSSTAPTVAATQADGPAGQLVVYAKLYDVGPDGADRAAPPADLPGPRRPTSTKPVTIELPGDRAPLRGRPPARRRARRRRHGLPRLERARSRSP